LAYASTTLQHSSIATAKVGSWSAMSDLVGRVVGAASQGAVGAVVAANLSAVTEPVVNAMLVKRATLAEALKEVDAQRVAKYLKTTLATNFIKFPFF